MTGSAGADERWGRLIAQHFAARAASRPDPPQLSAASQLAHLVVGGSAAAVGLPPLALSMWRLREAYVHHGTGAGVDAGEAFYPAALGAVLAVVAVVGLLNASRGASRRVSLVLWAVALLHTLAVVATWALALWVEGRIGCLDSCG